MTNVKMEITRNIITVDDTAAVSALSELCVHVCLDSGTNKI